MLASPNCGGIAPCGRHSLNRAGAPGLHDVQPRGLGVRFPLQTWRIGMHCIASEDPPARPPAAPVPTPPSPYSDRDPMPVDLPPDEPLPENAPPPLRA